MKTFGIALLLSATSIFSSYTQNSEIKNLIFEGGGIRGIAYAGVVQSLEQEGIIKNIEKVGGTSAGAIIALLVALDYSAEEMTSIISDTEFQKFNDGKYIFFGGIRRTRKRYGWYQGEKFNNWIGELIKAKTGNANITFEELYEQGYKELSCTATCLNQQRLIVLSKATYPEMKLKDAVRISISIPLYYQAVFVDSDGEIYNQPKEGKDLDIMVDGGIIGNFPIHIFDTVKSDSLNRKIRIPNFETLGIRIDSDEQIQEDAVSNNLAPYSIENFTDYIAAFYAIVMENLNRQQLTENDWARTISVSSVGIDPKIKKLSEEQKQRLINSGINSTNQYLLSR